MTRKPSTPSPSKKKPPAWSMGLLLVIPVALAGALYLDSMPGKPYIPPPSTTTASTLHNTAVPMVRWKGLENRVAKLEQQYTTLSESVAHAPSVPAAKPPAPAEGSSVAPQEIESLKQQLQRLEADIAKRGLYRNALLVSLYRLEKTAENGKPFAKELDILLEDSNLPERVHRKLHALTETSLQGIAGRHALKRLFEETMEAYTSGAARIPEGESTWGQVKRNLSSLISIRKVGDAGGEGDDANLARAETALKEDDIVTAITEIAGLTDQTAPYFEEWFQKARKRQKTLQSIERARVLIEEEEAPVPLSSPAPTPGSV